MNSALLGKKKIVRFHVLSKFLHNQYDKTYEYETFVYSGGASTAGYEKAFALSRKWVDGPYFIANAY